MSAPEGNPFNLRTGVELLRLTVRLCDNANESFNMRFTADELCKLASAWERAEHDIPPYRWTEQQVQECIKHGLAPKWDDDEKPVHAFDALALGIAELGATRPEDSNEDFTWTNRETGEICFSEECDIVALGEALVAKVEDARKKWIEGEL